MVRSPMKGYISEDALAQYSRLVAEKQGLNFSENETYDFARCMRPDGSVYGTRGKCRKGTETGDQTDPDKVQGDVRKRGDVGKRVVAQVSAQRETDKKERATPKRKPATSAEAKPAWQETEKAAKTAKDEFKRVKAETKGDKSPEARKRLLQAGIALDRAERAAQKASDKYFAAAKRESRAAMTPEQRKEEREWQRTKKRMG